MTSPITRFEVSSDVCGRAGPRLDALVTRVARYAEELGERLVLVGPWRLRDPMLVGSFDDDPSAAPFASACRALGVPVRVGRWKILGHPRVILVDGSGLRTRRDDLLARLWEAHRVDSFGADDTYAETVLFGVAAGLVIDRYAAEYVAPRGGRGILVAEDATAGAALLDATTRSPELGTIYVAHRTVVGGALADAGEDAAAVLAAKGPEGIAADRGLRTRHSLEAACVRVADAVAAVGETTAGELLSIHGRRPTVVCVSDADADAIEPAVVEARRRATERGLGAFVGAEGGHPARTGSSNGLSPKARRHASDLRRLASNLAWTWDEGARAVLADLEPAGFEAGREDPIGALADAPPARLEALVADGGHVARLREALARLDALVSGTSSAPGAPVALPHPVAYFCAEFGVHASLPVYSGGLGILAGDHVKAASDRGLAFVGVGLFYRHGYVRQVINEAGDQVPLPVDNDPRRLPVELVTEDGRAVTVHVELPGSVVTLAVWRVRVGRVSLLLLDADVPGNHPDDRAITARLYGGGSETRLRQEILLGIGGMRLLERLGVEPAAIHLNEGHAAFAPLERVSCLHRRDGLAFDVALARVRATTLFTTHTPVPAGHDRFDAALVRRYFSDAPTWLGTSYPRFLDLGRVPGEADGFNMTWLGLHASCVHNGVSRLHGRVSRRLLAPAFPGVAEDAVPVTSVTNGVHLPTWTAPEIARLLGAEGRAVTGADFSARARGLDDAALFAARAALRKRLLARVRADVERSAARRREPLDRADRMLAGLTEGALLVGFARRFATYKRADLLLRDVERLARIASNAARPVRFLYAGKAHPNDREGLGFVRKVVDATRTEQLLGKVVFLEDYDAALARLLVQGVDVWLNTPLRGLEASGTSGMKAAANGVLNVSVRDGWWDEAYDGTNGFAIGAGPEGAGDAEDDKDREAAAALLEGDVATTFFDRDAGGLPRRWLERVKACLATIPPVFDSVRMVGEYEALAYGPFARAAAAVGAGLRSGGGTA